MAESYISVWNVSGGGHGSLTGRVTIDPEVATNAVDGGLKGPAEDELVLLENVDGALSPTGNDEHPPVLWAPSVPRKVKEKEQGEEDGEVIGTPSPFPFRGMKGARKEWENYLRDRAFGRLVRPVMETAPGFILTMISEVAAIEARVYRTAIFSPDATPEHTTAYFIKGVERVLMKNQLYPGEVPTVDPGELEERAVVLQDLLDAEVKYYPGLAFAIAGTSGSGKTTFMTKAIRTIRDARHTEGVAAPRTALILAQEPNDNKPLIDAFMEDGNGSVYRVRNLSFPILQAIISREQALAGSANAEVILALDSGTDMVWSAGGQSLPGGLAAGAREVLVQAGALARPNVAFWFVVNIPHSRSDNDQWWTAIHGSFFNSIRLSTFAEDGVTGLRDRIVTVGTEADGTTRRGVLFPGLSSPSEPHGLV